MVSDTQTSDRMRTVLVHDLKTPMRAARQLIGLMLVDRVCGPPQRDRRYLHSLDASLSMMEERIEAMLRLERVADHRLTVERLDTADIARAALAEVVAAGRADVTVEIGDLPHCYGDRVLVQQVFSNLLDNAIKYGGGTIRVRGTMHLDGAAFWVSDEGPGVPGDWSEQVFQPFRRGPRPSDVSGHGLGLAIVRRIIERHGGAVALARGPGFTMRFRLPARPWQDA